MGLFGSSAYQRWQNEVDSYPVLEKGKSPLQTPEALMANIKGGAALIEKIKEAGSRGELTSDQANELVQQLQARARKGLAG